MLYRASTELESVIISDKRRVVRGEKEHSSSNSTHYSPTATYIVSAILVDLHRQWTRIDRSMSSASIPSDAMLRTA